MKFSIRGAVTAIGVASMLVAGSIAPAQAGGGAFAGGLIGGIIGGAIANGQPRYYAPAPVYVAPAPVYQPVCHWQRQRYCDAYTGCSWRRVQICQ